MDPQKLEKLLAVSREMAETRLLDPLLEYAMGVALELCDGQKGYLVLIDEAGELEFRVRQDSNGNRLEAPESQISHTIFQQVIETRQPQVIADAVYDPQYRHADSVISLRLRSVMCLPLISRGNLLGALYIENRRNQSIFDQEDLSAMKYFAAQAAVSIENAMLYDQLEARVAQRTVELEQVVEQLEQRTQELVDANSLLAKEIVERRRAQEELHKLAITDSLTGIFNRRHFFKLSEQAFHQASGNEQYLAALMMDVDHFKQVNDLHGHAIGDQVLQAIAGCFRQCVSPANILGRYGGEEFIILMPQTDLEKAIQSAEQLRQEMETWSVQTTVGVMKLTISIGVAVYDSERDQTIDDLINRADQALYVAKQTGRNRVIAWEQASDAL